METRNEKKFIKISTRHILAVYIAECVVNMRILIIARHARFGYKIYCIILSYIFT